MAYYDIKWHESELLYKLRSPVVNLIYADRKVQIDFSSHGYVAVSADKIPREPKDFEDNCRRYLHGISPIKMGFKESKEFDMIRTETEVLILRVLQEDYDARFQRVLRADQHIVEKINLKKFAYRHKVDLAESLESDRLERYIKELLRGLLQEIGVPENSECECYMVHNRKKIFLDEAKTEKFYFFHNALRKRIVYVAYRLLRTGYSVTEENETEDDNVEEEGDSSRSNSEVGDEDPEIGDETEEERVDSMTTDLEGGDRSENCLPEFCVSSRLPQLGACNLYYVNRDTLFSRHTVNELFLQRMMALYSASHDENSPNDLLLMADAPADHLFVLLGPVEESGNRTDILCVLQVSLEGRISQKSAFQPFGDRIHYMFSKQFADQVSSLSGARIVRIAAHQCALRMGYESTAVELLARYFEGQSSMVEENVTPRTDLPTLLVPLRERQPERLHYFCVSFGLNLDLFRFWRKHKFAPLFIDHAPNRVTGEFTCMVLKALKNDDVEAFGSDEWGFYGPFYPAFKRKLVELFSSTYREMNYKLAMSVLDPKINFVKQDPASASSGFLNLESQLRDDEMKRLKRYSNNQIEYIVIRDVAQKLARIYFKEQLPVSFSDVQASILFCYGLQKKDIPEIEREMDLKRERILDYYLEVMQSLYEYLNNLTSKEDSTVSRLKAN